jgi:15-cis-phytoene synthase
MTGAREGARARDRLVAALAAEAEALHRELGIPLPRVEGKLLRPLVALAASGDAREEGGALEDRRILRGALAIQMAHEASLLHDDILDDCAVRRGAASVASRLGVGAALVAGDHLLTASYRVAAGAGSLEVVTAFSTAVERTVAGEIAQARAVGRVLTEAEYREIVAGKSGALFGCAAALGALLRGDADGARRDHELGVRIGCVYQRIDDFLDLCPGAELGKPPLLDLAQRKWTWPLAELERQAFPTEADRAAFVRRLFQGDPAHGGVSPMRRALGRLEGEVEALLGDWAAAHPGDRLVPEVLESWIAAVRGTLDREEEAGVDPDGEGSPTRRRPGRTGAALGTEAAVRAEALALGGPEGWSRAFAHHARTFHFAARLFPAEAHRLVSGVYAFCRFTDDLVDRAPDPDPELLRVRLQAWAGLVRRGWSRRDTGIPLLDEIMGATAERGVSVLYAEELIRGVGMDLEPVVYEDPEALRVYTYRVASVVGLWLTELFGTHDPAVLRRAEAMGHAMQLTNIVRDVGEDARSDRIYLPRSLMRAHGVTEEAIHRGARGGGLPDGWAELMEALLAEAEDAYASAFEAIPALPAFFQRPVAVAARVYAGIHDEVRRSGCDTLTLRAHTGIGAKLRLGAGALRDLSRARRRFHAREAGSLSGVSFPSLPPAARPAGP